MIIAITIWNFLINGILVLALLYVLLILNGVVSRAVAARFQTGLAPVNTAEVDGIQVGYLKKGTGPPLLLLHGLMCTSFFFRPILERLAKDFTVYAVDIIGFGRSDKRPTLDYTKRHMAEVARNFMLTQGIEQFAVIGHSMGGEVALNMACYFPQNVQRLVLVGTAGQVRSRQLPRWIWGHKGLTCFLLRNVFLSFPLQYYVCYLSVYRPDRLPTQEFQESFALNAFMPAETLYRLMKDAEREQLGDQLQNIRQPALIIWGQHDRIIAKLYGEKLHQQLPNSRLQILENCGHLVYLEDPEVFLKLVKQFLGN